MRIKGLVIAGAALAGLGACSDSGKAEISHSSRNPDREVRAVARLDCPDREGDLRLVSTASDGRACAYRDADGGEVELRLTGDDGRAELADLEMELRELVPAAAAPPEPPEPPLPPTPPSPDGEANEEKTRVAIGGLVDIRTEGDRASVRLPGVRVEANGENADVRLGDGEGESVTVRAREGGAEVRTSDDARGELSSTFILASEKAGPSGWRVAGYQARGAHDGPLVVAVVRSRRDRQNDLMNDVEDLIDRNIEG